MKWIKRLGLLLVTVLLLLIIAVGLFMAIFDPNDYKTEIQQAVKDETGRDLTIAGDISWSWYPALGVDVADITLSNAEGFGDEPQMQANSASIYVQVLPLISGNIEVDGIALDGLILRITRNAQGVSNTDDLAAKFAEEEFAEEEEAASTDDEVGTDSEDDGGPQIAISSISITNTELYYDDEQADEHYHVKALNIVMPDGIAIDMANNLYAVPAWEISLHDELRIAGELNANRLSEATELTGRLELDDVDITRLVEQLTGGNGLSNPSLQDLPSAARSELQFSATLHDDETIQARLHELELEVTYNGENISLNLAELAVNTASETAELQQLQLNAAGLALVVDATAEQIMQSATYQGSLQTNEFSPRELLAALDIDIPALQDANTLQTASLVAQFSGSTTQAAMQDLTLKLDSTTATGELAVNDFAGIDVAGQLVIDRVNVDSYMPQEADGSSSDDASSSEGEGDVNDVEIPVAVLRQFTAKLGLDIGWLQVADMTFTDITTQLDAKDGLVWLKPLKFQSYQGQFDGYARIDARRDEPTYEMQSRLDHFAAAEMQQAVLEQTYMSGIVFLDGQLNTRGRTVGEMRRNLRGKVSPKVNDGAVLGLNLAKYMRQIKTLFTGGDWQQNLMAAATAEDSQTDFSAITVDCLIDAGVARCDNLDARTPGLRIGGLGKIDLFAETLDYTVNLSVVETSQGQGGEDLDELKGVTIPVRCKGSWAEPTCLPDLEDVLKEKAKDELQDRITEELDERLGEEGREFLEGLFN